MSEEVPPEPRSSEQLPGHQRPEGVGDRTVSALGTLSEAFEAVESARGFLYTFHRVTGTADITLGKAIDEFRDAGHDDLADRLEQDLLGRNVLQDRWTFQIVEEYDETYYEVFKELERTAREQLVGGRRHLFEAEMKERGRTHGHPRHTARPEDDAGPQ
jgi:hypothetical protein